MCVYVCKMSGTKHISCTAALKLKVIEFAEKFGNRKAERENRKVKSLCEMGESRSSSSQCYKDHPDHIILRSELTLALA